MPLPPERVGDNGSPIEPLTLPAYYVSYLRQALLVVMVGLEPTIDTV